MPAGAMQPLCEHSAVLHRGAHDLSRRLRSGLRRASDEGAAVLLCLDGAAEARIRADFGSMCEQFTFQPADDRYATPGMAMAALNNFVDTAQQSGATGAWSIGAIPLRADGRDARWLRYEEAVDEVFFDRPLRALCLYDAETTPAHLRDEVRRTHQSLDGDWTDSSHDNRKVVDVLESIPIRCSDRLIRNPSPAAARAALKSLVGERVSEAVMLDMQLVASELVTNAAIHGATPTWIEMWHEADGLALRVTDSGLGGVGRHEHLRPARGRAEGGFGLTAVGKLADSVEITRHHDITVVSVYMALR